VVTIRQGKMEILGPLRSNDPRIPRVRVGSKWYEYRFSEIPVSRRGRREGSGVPTKEEFVNDVVDAILRRRRKRRHADVTQQSVLIDWQTCGRLCKSKRTFYNYLKRFGLSWNDLLKEASEREAASRHDK